MTPPLDRLRERVAALGVPLCVGVDPHPDRLPGGLPRDAAGIEAFASGLVDATRDEIVAVKLNVAFFEALGSPGLAALERVRGGIPSELVVIVDAKRGDIGPTAERYAQALFGSLGADGVTVSPYLGEDAVEPFVSWPDRLVYVLARTSNPSARRFQDLEADGEPIHLRVARWVADMWPGGRVGLVVGATAAMELERVRELVPGPPFLIPGIGAQGGDLRAAARAHAGAWGPGLVSVSRGIAEASRGRDWQEAAANAVGRLRIELTDAVLHSTPTAAPSAEIGGS